MSVGQIVILENNSLSIVGLTNDNNVWSRCALYKNSNEWVVSCFRQSKLFDMFLRAVRLRGEDVAWK